MDIRQALAPQGEMVKFQKVEPMDEEQIAVLRSQWLEGQPAPYALYLVGGLLYEAAGGDTLPFIEAGDTINATTALLIQSRIDAEGLILTVNHDGLAADGG